MARKKDSSDGAGGEPADGAGIDPAVAHLSYEDAMAELERLVESIEQGDVGLEATLATYRRGEHLLRHCKVLLDRAETTVRQMSLAEIEAGADPAKPVR